LRGAWRKEGGGGRRNPTNPRVAGLRNGAWRDGFGLKRRQGMYQASISFLFLTPSVETRHRPLRHFYQLHFHQTTTLVVSLHFIFYSAAPQLHVHMLVCRMSHPQVQDIQHMHAMPPHPALGGLSDAGLPAVVHHHGKRMHAHAVTAPVVSWRIPTAVGGFLDKKTMRAVDAEAGWHAAGRGLTQEPGESGSQGEPACQQAGTRKCKENKPGAARN
jgi:hypothetical protein